MNYEEKLIYMKKWYHDHRDEIIKKYHDKKTMIICEICDRKLISHNIGFHLQTAYHKKRAGIAEVVEQDLKSDISEFFKYRVVPKDAL